jgi:hypothetical protein
MDLLGRSHRIETAAVPTDVGRSQVGLRRNFSLLLPTEPNYKLSGKEGALISRTGFVAADWRCDPQTSETTNSLSVSAKTYPPSLELISAGGQSDS